MKKSSLCFLCGLAASSLFVVGLAFIPVLAADIRDASCASDRLSQSGLLKLIAQSDDSGDDEGGANEVPDAKSSSTPQTVQPPSRAPAGPPSGESDIQQQKTIKTIRKGIDLLFELFQ